MNNKFVVSGYKKSGKTTLVKKILKNSNSAAGFFTEKFPDRLTKDGLCPIYIYPVFSDPVFDDEHLIGLGGEGTHYTNCEVFDKLGIELITVSDPKTLIVMDEIGFLERDARRFQEKVFEVLNSENPVLIIMKQKMRESFMKSLKSFPGIEYIELSEENQDAVFEYINKRLNG